AAKRWNVLRQQAAAGQQIAEDARAGARVQQGPESRLGVVAEEAADLAPPRRHAAAGDGHRHIAIVVAQVAVAGAGAEVHPLPEVGVTKEPVVVLVRVPLKDTCLDLAADAAVRPEGCAATDFRAKDLRVRSDAARPFQTC